MDKVFYNVLGKASYLPFRESNDFCPRIIGKGVNSVNLKDHRNVSENPTLGQNKKNPNTATHDQRNTKPSPSNKVANASQLSNNSRTPSHKENSKKHPSFDFRIKMNLRRVTIGKIWKKVILISMARRVLMVKMRNMAKRIGMAKMTRNLRKLLTEVKKMNLSMQNIHPRKINLTVR